MKRGRALQGVFPSSSGVRGEQRVRVTMSSLRSGAVGLSQGSME